jgi:hypothetical protein
MSGYIGKIAAIVTANTSDFTAKLAGSKNELKTFAGSIQSTISSASNRAGNSFNAIFTPLQKLTRALDAGLRAPLELVDILEVRKLQTLVSLSEGLAKPLAGATRQFEQLSQQAQANFLPALIRSQTAVKALQTAFEATGQASGTGFEQARRQIERTTQSVQRLAQAQQLASKTLTGNELQFRNPRLAQTLAAGAALSQQAAALPADRLQDGAIGRQTAALKQYQDAAVAAQARVENLQLTPNVDPSVLKAAESQLLNLVKTAERAKAQLNQSVNPIGTGFTSRGAAAGPAGLGLFGSQVGGEAEQAVARARTLSAEFAKLPQAAQSGLAGLAGIASRISDEVSQTGSGASQLQKVLDRLQQSIKQTQNVAASGSTALIIRPPDADVTITKTPRDLVGDFEKLQRDRSQARQESVSSALGPALDDPKRQIDATVGRVAALKGQLDSLPASIRSQFIPAIKAAEAQLLALAGSTNATPAQIKRAADEVARLEAAAKRAKQALAIPTSGDFLGGLSAQRAIGELEALRGVLAQVGAQVGGPVAAAYDKYAAATRNAIANNTIGLPKVQADLKKIAIEAAIAAAATGKISFGQALKLIERGGDVATKSFNNVGLAVNQLAFAVDDFFSVTGGAEQRIRAIGNNITQFGVIIGQTKGLIIALAAVLTAQGIVAFIRYANGGAGAEDRIKSLNDALARQKSLVEDLAGAFSSLAQEIGRIGFSESQSQAAELNKKLEDIRKKQREVETERLALVDPEVQRERGIINARQRELEKAENPSTRVTLAAQLREAQQRERQRIRELQDTPDIRPVDLVNQVFGARLRTELAGVPTATFTPRGLAVPTDAVTAATRRSQAAADEFSQPFQQLTNDRQIEEARNLARQEQARLARLIAENSAFGIDNPGPAGAANAPARQEIERLEAGLILLEQAAVRAAGQLEVEVAEASIKAARRIETAQELIANAIEAGTPGASVLQASLGGLVDKLEQTNTDLAEAQAKARDSGLGADFDAARAAQQQVAAINREIDGRNLEAAAIDSARQALDRFAEALSRASQEAQQNLSAAQSAADETRAADLGRPTPQSQEQRQTAEADLRRQQELASGVEQEIAAARERFTQGPQNDPRFELAKEVMEAGVRARQIGKDENLPGGLLEDRARALRGAGRFELAAEVDEAIELMAQAVNELGLDLDNGFWDGIQAILGQGASGVSEELIAAARRIAEIDNVLSTQGVLGEGQREALVRERAAIEQQVVEQDPAVRAARDESTAEEQRRQQAERGRQLAQTPGEKAAESLLSDLNDVRQRFGRQAEEGTGLVDFEAQNAAQQRLINDSLRSAAPALFGLGDAVQNAVLQGPSRAALQATDVSTVEGASELNRLLRGDDAARDQDLAELQKQSAALEELVRIAREGGVDIAN